MANFTWKCRLPGNPKSNCTVSAPNAAAAMAEARKKTGLSGAFACEK